MRMGIVGSGAIVATALDCFELLDQTTCTALYHRPHSRETARRLAERYAIGTLHDDFEEFLADDCYDVAYIALVNSAHFAHAKAALLAGKHVICEKPLTSTLAEAEELVQLAKEKGRFLVEAIIPRYAPTLPALREAVGRLGRVTILQSNYSQRSSRYDAYLAGQVLPAFDPALSGGCLYDINVYNVHVATLLFGAPRAVRYHANLGHNGVDTSGVLILDYDGFKAVCIAAKDSSSSPRTTIQGDAGYLVVDSLPHTLSNVTVVTLDGERRIEGPPTQHSMQHEFTAIAQMISAGDLAGCHAHLDQSLTVMRILQAARDDAGIVFEADQR